MKEPNIIRSEARKAFSPYYIYCLIIVMIHFIVIGMQGALTSGGMIVLRLTGNALMMQTLIILSAVAGFFIATPMEVGVKFFFLNLIKGEAEMNNIISPFKNSYDRAVIIIFMRNLLIILWSVLLIVPGIIKAYEYAMVPYIVAQKPDILRKEAFDRSKKLMAGNKMNLFKLQISFLGWYILALIPLGAGLMFLAPYTNTAYALFYEELKNKA